MLAHLVGGKDLTANRLSNYPGRGVYGLSTQVTIPLGDMAGMDANAEIDGTLWVGGVVLLHGALNASGGTDRCHS